MNQRETLSYAQRAKPIVGLFGWLDASRARPARAPKRNSGRLSSPQVDPASEQGGSPYTRGGNRSSDTHPSTRASLHVEDRPAGSRREHSLGVPAVPLRLADGLRRPAPNR
jgi:hypothetical protein